VPRPPGGPCDPPRPAARRCSRHPQRRGRVPPAVIDNISYPAFLAEELFVGQLTDDTLFEVAIIHHTQCGTGLLAFPGFRHQAAAATGLPETALEASAAAEPHTTVKADVEHLLTSPLLSPKVSVSSHVYDIATGRVTTTHDAALCAGRLSSANSQHPPGGSAA
jgi:carbonic anhydrase